MTEESLPVFPRLAPVGRISRSAFERALPDDEFGSDFQWLSIRTWNRDASAAVLDGGLVLQLRDYHDPRQTFFAFTGGRQPATIIRHLLQRAVRVAEAPWLRFVSERALCGLDPAEFRWVEDRDNFDYVYSCPATVQAVGTEYKQLRRECAQFSRSVQGDYRMVVTDARAADVDGILELTSAWAAAHKDPGSADEEREAVSAFLELGLSLPSDGRVLVSHLYVGGTLAAYLVDEIRGAWAIGHFGHATTALPGAGTFLRREVAAELHRRGVNCWNEEQDLGVAGLRRRKLSNRPTCFVRKYSVTLRSYVSNGLPGPPHPHARAGEDGPTEEARPQPAPLKS